MTVAPYLEKAEALLREGRSRLDRMSVVWRSPAPAFSALARRRKLTRHETKFSELNRLFETLRLAGNDGVTDLRIRLEHACEAFRVEMGGP